MFGFAKRFLQFLGSTADLQRFGKWKNDLEDALEQLEKRYKGKKISQETYKKEKADINKKLRESKNKPKKQLEDWDEINRLEDEIKKLEIRYKEEHMGKKEYEERKAILKEKLKKSKKLIKKSKERLEESKLHETRL
ncbi:MAG: hypothetical protein KKA79_02655 [Nanoarchaeota archaeon]|nr:hypothetical protein [Nanoarchaeota archaeon]MCG2717508.1 hypothetical protein [Nanoarchaeota archaeon]